MLDFEHILTSSLWSIPREPYRLTTLCSYWRRNFNSLCTYDGLMRHKIPTISNKAWCSLSFSWLQDTMNSTTRASETTTSRARKSDLRVPYCRQNFAEDWNSDKPYEKIFHLSFARCCFLNCLTIVALRILKLNVLLWAYALLYSRWIA